MTTYLLTGTSKGGRPLPHPEMLERAASGALEFKTGEKTMALLAKYGIDPDIPSITYRNHGQLASGAWFFVYELAGNRDTQPCEGSTHAFTIRDARKKLMVTSTE